MAQFTNTVGKYTVSLITHGYGSETGLLEVGIWETDTGDWFLGDLTGYDFSEGRGVLGWLTGKDVSNIIKALEERVG